MGEDNLAKARAAGAAAAQKYFISFTWPEAILLSLREAGVIDVSDETVRASTPLGAGLGLTRQTCGSLMAGALAIGLRHGRADLTGSRGPSWVRTARLVRLFEERYGTTSCAAITGGYADFASPERIGCCMQVIAFVTEAVAQILAEPAASFADPDRAGYFAVREAGNRL